MSKDENSTKVRIVNCAIQLFKENGYNNVTVNDICKLSGITRSAFYYHFKSKDEILDNYFILSENHVAQNLLPILNSSNYYDQFLQIFETFLKQIIDAGPEIFGQVLKRNIDKEVHLLAPREFAMWDVYVTLIRKAQEAGEILNPQPPEQLVDSIVYLSNGIDLIWCNKKGSFDIIAEHRRMLETLLKLKKDS
jgi:AcrR family transcriptional regulator